MHLSIFNFKPIRYTCIFLLCMVTIGGAFKIWILKNAPEGLRPLPTAFWIFKTHTPKHFDAVIIGDSRVYRGVSPLSMQKYLKDWAILNFGYSSGGMNHVLLKGGEDKLDNNGRRVIILGLTPYSLTNSAALNEHYKSFKKTLPWPYKIPYLNIIFSPEETSWAISELMGIKKKKYFQIPHDDGWVESDQIPENTESAMFEYKQRFDKEKISKSVLKELFIQVRLWTNQGYTVFAFRPPVSEHMENLENAKSGYDEAFIKSEISKAGGIWIDIADRFAYHTYDGSHLNSRSAKNLSEYIALFIANKINFSTKQP